MFGQKCFVTHKYDANVKKSTFAHTGNEEIRLKLFVTYGMLVSTLAVTRASVASAFVPIVNVN